MKIKTKTTRVHFSARIDPSLKFILDIIKEGDGEEYFNNVIVDGLWEYIHKKGFKVKAEREKSADEVEVEVPEKYKHIAENLNKSE